MKKICVVGLGYIGLPTALSLAGPQMDVVGVDYNKDLVEMLNQGCITFQEEGLPELFARAVKNNIRFAMQYEAAELYIIAVPTPYMATSKKIDITYVKNAVKEVLDICPKGAAIVIESTVSPGTIDEYIRPLVAQKGLVSGVDVHLAHAPERIIPGRMIAELKSNSRTIGADSREIAEQIKKVYQTFCEGEIILTDIKTAEMTKVVENTFRDINIAFANELAKICHHGGMNVHEIIRIANYHPRVNVLTPGPGVGGHCISVDPWFLVGDYPSDALLIHQARKINDSMPEFVLERTQEIMKKEGITDVSRVGIYGLSYKEDVDDTRESPTLQLLQRQQLHLAKPLKVYDPMIEKKVIESQCLDFDAFLQDVDMVILMVAHTHIKENMARLKGKVIFDTRNVCTLEGCYKL